MLNQRTRPTELEASESMDRLVDPLSSLIVNDNVRLKRLRLLLLCDFTRGTASTIVDHIRGLKLFSQHSIYVFNSRGDVSDRLRLEHFDGVIVHYSLVACMDSYIGPKLRVAIRNFTGLKAAFVQDDYRWIDQTTDALVDLGIHILFGLAPSEIIDQVYPPERLPGVIRETVLTGYVPSELLARQVPNYQSRAIDVGYRARKLPAWLGSFGQEKWLIADRFERDAANFGLICDMSTREEDRIYGEDWIKFLANCKAVLGTESGASVCDFTGEIQRKVEAHVATDPDTSFESLRDLYFKNEDGQIVLSVISPRCFEAAALRTLMILYEGHYSGILKPWRHYIPLKKDHSNMANVVGVLRDREQAQRIIDWAYREVAQNPENSFEAMARQVDRAIERAFRPEMARTIPPYGDFTFVVLLGWSQLIAWLTTRTRRMVGLMKRSLKWTLVKVVRLVVIVAPAPIRRWGKSKLARWPAVCRVIGVNI